MSFDLLSSIHGHATDTDLSGIPRTIRTSKSTHTTETSSDLVDLPKDIFLIITKYLNDIDLIRCRSVSKTWYRGFTQDLVLRGHLVSEYNRAREVRFLLANENGDSEGQIGIPANEPPFNWMDAFRRVVARYSALKSGMPASITKIALRVPSTADYIPECLKWKSVRTSSRHLDFHTAAPATNRNSVEVWKKALPIGAKETEWTYDDGLLIYYAIETAAVVLFDIEDGTTSVVPFDVSNRVVRRVRLNERVLIIEWMEYTPFAEEDGTFDPMILHFTTAFDILSVRDTFPWLTRWKVILKKEWEVYVNGFDLAKSACWLSVHDSKHYALYLWQDFHSTCSKPTQSLLIWDMTQSSYHQRSLHRHTDIYAHFAPQLVTTLSDPDLQHFNIHLKRAVYLNRLELDEGTVYFIEEVCDTAVDWYTRHQSMALGLPRYCECVIGIPICGEGPRWEDRNTEFSAPLMLDAFVTTSGSQYREPKRATCWRYNGIYPCFRWQRTRDLLAGIDFVVEMKMNGRFELRIKSSQGWASKLDMDDIGWHGTQIACDERWIILQINDDLHIFRFDIESQMSRRQAKENGNPTDKAIDYPRKQLTRRQSCLLATGFGLD